MDTKEKTMELNWLERLAVGVHKIGLLAPSTEYSCPYDGSSYHLFKKFSKKPVPEGSRDLGVEEWHLHGECPNCRREVRVIPDPGHVTEDYQLP